MNVFIFMARWSKEKRAEARGRILDAARAVFARDGFEGATMRAIAEGAQLAVGTLFNYFANKRDLLFAALLHDLDGVHERCVGSMPHESATLPDAFVHVAGCYFDYYAENPALSRTLLKESLFAQGEAAEAFQAQVTRAGELLVDRVQCAQASGQLRSDASARNAVLAFVSHYDFVLLMSLRDEPDTAVMRGLIRTLADQLVQGLRAQE